jgi:ABC-type polysaccharide/polyol phosphate export permease
MFFDYVLGWTCLRLGLRRQAFTRVDRVVEADTKDRRAQLLLLEILIREQCFYAAGRLGQTIRRDSEETPLTLEAKHRIAGQLAARRATRRASYNIFDAFIEFLSNVRAMILRDLLLLSKTNLFQSFAAPVRVAANTLGHAYLYLLVVRPVPPGMSFLTFCMPVFIIWQAFDHAFYYADPQLHKYRSQDEIHHFKWLHAFAAMVGWDMISTAFVCAAIFFVYQATGETLISRPLNFDSLPLFLAMYGLAVAMGLGVGAIHHYAKKMLPALDVIGKLAAFVLYLTSGVYDSYAAEPAALREVFILNPLLPIMEYSRMAFARNYYVANLNIWYSVIFTALSLALGLMLLRKLMLETER